MLRVISLSAADLSTRRLSPEDHFTAFAVCRGSIGGEALSPNQWLYLRETAPGQLLKAFRGVRAISQFDWPFTPTPSSSKTFSTVISSALHPLSRGLQPGRG